MLGRSDVPIRVQWTVLFADNAIGMELFYGTANEGGWGVVAPSLLDQQHIRQIQER